MTVNESSYLCNPDFAETTAETQGKERCKPSEVPISRYKKGGKLVFSTLSTKTALEEVLILALGKCHELFLKLFFSNLAANNLVLHFSILKEKE